MDNNINGDDDVKCEIDRKIERKMGESNVVVLTVTVYDYSEGNTLKLGIADIEQKNNEE